MRELLLKIRALLISLRGGTLPPLGPAAAVALALMERGDLYAGEDALLPVDDVLIDQPAAHACSAMRAAGAACALKRYDRGSVACAAIRAGDAQFDQALTLAVDMALPVIYLVPVRENDLTALTDRVMALNMTCVTADGRDVMLLLPAIRSALDTAREGDGPTLIQCVTDREPDDDTPGDPIQRLDRTLLLEGYAEPEELT